MNTVQINEIKDQVIGLKRQGNAIQSLGVLKRYFDDDVLMSAMDERQLSYSDDVVMDLVEKTREETQCLSADHPDTDLLNSLLEQIDEVSDSSIEQGIPIWDISMGIDDACPASDQQISDLVDVLSGRLVFDQKS